ncbi:hypothetical protein AB0M54_06345 [Actinoplanes sp. NPDC051470]|uniref:hypothetical protein n=1 Tax=Actinoplanes sp. NPDC051470 TaxID=3157224 RepID=UPI0034226DA8
MDSTPAVLTDEPFEVVLGFGGTVWKGELDFDGADLIGWLTEQAGERRAAASVAAREFHLYDRAGGVEVEIGRVLGRVSDSAQRVAHSVGGRFNMILGGIGRLSCDFRDDRVTSARLLRPGGSLQKAWLTMPELLVHLTRAFRRVDD